MPRRILMRQEFEDLKRHVLDAAPQGLSDEDFKRYVGPAMAQAIGEAENTPKRPEGSALARLASNAWDKLNPVAIVEGAATAVRHPVQTLQNMQDSLAAEREKAKENFQQGRYSEAVGHGVASVIPGLGPAAADAGEQIASGDVAGGIGSGVGLVAGVESPRIVRGTVRGARAVVENAPAVARQGVNVAKAAARSPVVRGAVGAGVGYAVHGIPGAVEGALTGGYSGRIGRILRHLDDTAHAAPATAPAAVETAAPAVVETAPVAAPAAASAQSTGGGFNAAMERAIAARRAAEAAQVGTPAPAAAAPTPAVSPARTVATSAARASARTGNPPTPAQVLKQSVPRGTSLTAAEFNEGLRMLKAGLRPEDIVPQILKQRELVKRLGTPSGEAVRSAVQSRNANGRWN